VFLGDDVGEQRWRGQRPRESLGRQRCRLEVGVAVSVDRAVLDPRDNQTPMAAALPAELVAHLEPDSLGLPRGHELIEHRICDFDPLLGNVHLAEITAPGGLPLVRSTTWRSGCAARAGPGAGSPLLLGELGGERIERGEVLRELELELGAIDPLGLRDEDPTAEQLEILAQALVRGAQLIALFGQLVDEGPTRGMRGALGRERRLQRRNTCEQHIGRWRRRLHLVHRREPL
jgi:hypothetical protein